MFSKLIKGHYIEDKRPETIVNAIIKSWIIGDGFGPGHPTMGFYSDNGGEFLNQEVIDFASTLDTTIKMTAANAPWQNGTVERNHAVADIILEKIMIDNPGMKIQDAINKLMQGKTSLIIAHKFSTIKKCDKIILIDKGRIVAQGTHEELINSNSSYKNMNELQI